ncbi:SUKH-4 family immunity protein [Streptomyces panaciradicis]|uniref:SUKH-4 family immunity protein n=1 Tax=Streptomyces panaciradicis TaxID=1470261 RepID=UPI0035580F4B
MPAPARNDLLLTSAPGGEDRDDGRVPELAGLVEQDPALGASARTAPARSWLDASFGQGTCRRLPESALPIDLVHEGSRHFLTTVGLPELTDHLPFVRTIGVDRTGQRAPQPPRVGGPDQSGDRRRRSPGARFDGDLDAWDTE